MSKKFNPIDLLKEIDYDNFDKTTVEDYEEHILKIMLYDKCSLLDALHTDFEMNMLDIESVFDVTDYLEEHLESLGKVSFYMGVFCGDINDFVMTKKKD